MARPSKYSPELKDQLVGYIADGLTVRDACYGAGISEDTFWRWNREKLDFAEVIRQATETAKQKWSSEALMYTSAYRRYARKARICSRKALNHRDFTRTHFDDQNLQKRALEVSGGIFGKKLNRQVQTTIGSLPVRSEPPINAFGELVFSEPYYNKTTGKVEWVEKELYGRYVIHRCGVENWEKNIWN